MFRTIEFNVHIIQMHGIRQARRWSSTWKFYNKNTPWVIHGQVFKLFKLVSRAKDGWAGIRLQFGIQNTEMSVSELMAS